MKWVTKILSYLPSCSGIAIALTLTNCVPTLSESIPISRQLHQMPILIAQQTDCVPSGSNEYVYGTYKVQWTFQGLSYESVLRMEGGSGQMLTRYFNPNTNSPDTVLQTMKLHTCSFGLVIAGYNPRNPNTQSSHPSYIADNLLIRRQPNGSIIIFNCDDQTHCSPATVEEIR